MKRVSAKFVRCILTPEQKERFLSISLEIHDHVTSDPIFFQNVTTGDESWVYGYDLEKKVQSSQWKKPNSIPPKKPSQLKASVKVMLIVFFDVERIVLSEFVPSGTTVNTAYYKGVLERVRNDINRKRPQKWANDFVLHHDSAPCRISPLIHKFLSNKKNVLCLHPPYSPDVIPRGIWLFPKLKLSVKGKRFASIPEIEAATTTRLKGLTKDDFQNCFKKWQER
jgi:histone-lysine N-methyltransferase SETMAR